MTELIRTNYLPEAVTRFAEELASVAPPEDENASRLLAVAEAGLGSPEDAALMFMALSAALNDYAPAGRFFGPRPGDPESFGYWPQPPGYRRNAIRQDVGNLDEAALRGIFEDRKAKNKFRGRKAPEKELQKYRKLGFRDSEQLIPAGSLARKR